MTIFDCLYPKYKIKKPIRLIEFFAGYGSQALALKYLGVKFEHWKICEWAVKSIQAYKDIHFENENAILVGLDKEQEVERLYKQGISSNYNEPMTKQQIQRLSLEQIYRITENNLITHNLVNIQNVKGEDLKIVDTDKYDYILTYSFPCQDLSLAGKGKGMSDTSTRSGMLWEVERILTECHELGTLPQILLMENVPQVHGTDNLQDFNKWQLRLEELGYKNYMQDLIATDYGIPQTRNRCFMVSILGDYSYTFPKPIQLKLKLKDMLEDNVDEKYYLSDKMLNCFLSESEDSKFPRKERFIQTFNTTNEKGIAATITTAAGTRATDNFIKVKNATKKGYLEATDGDGIDISSRVEHHRGTVQKGKAQTLTTQCDRGVVTLGNYSPSNHNASRIVDKEHSAPTVMENHGTITAIVDKPKVLGGYGKIGSTGQYHQQNRVYDNNVGIAVTTCFNPNYVDNNLRIRKLTPKEYFRLMGVKDEDYNNVAKNQSDSSLYHLAGDSIVVNVLMAIFKEMI